MSLTARKTAEGVECDWLARMAMNRLAANSNARESAAMTRQQYAINLQLEAAYWADVARDEVDFWRDLHLPRGRSIELQRIAARVARSARVAAGIEEL